MNIRSYAGLSRLPSFEERFHYLRLSGTVGEETFGFERFLNQIFYKSSEWKRVRDAVILRDNGRDLGVEGRDIFGKILIHHMNPITRRDIETRSALLLDPEYLISTSHMTHNAIHYGDEHFLIPAPIERRRNDTCPWRR